MASIIKRTRTTTKTDNRGVKREVEVGYWRARYRDAAGKEHTRHFERKVDAQQWLDEVTTALVTEGEYSDPRKHLVTVGSWCDTWLAGRAGHRPGTVRRVKREVARIKAAFGPRPIGSIRPSEVREWLARLSGQYATRTVTSHYRTLVLVFADAVHDGVLKVSPCSKRTTPAKAPQRLILPTTEQVWALYDAMEEQTRTAVLLGAFVGLRAGEVCGLRVADVDFLRGVVTPAVQYPEDPLKTDESKNPVPIPRELVLVLSEQVRRWPGETILTGVHGQRLTPTALHVSWAKARAQVKGLPEGLRFHDLRHYFASYLISAGADVKVVQARMRHSAAVTTLDTYGHLWPDSDESTRTAVAALFGARAGLPADSLRTRGPAV